MPFRTQVTPGVLVESRELYARAIGHDGTPEEEDRGRGSRHSFGSALSVASLLSPRSSVSSSGR